MARAVKAVRRLLDVYCRCEVPAPEGTICLICDKLIKNKMGIVSRDGLGPEARVRDK